MTVAICVMAGDAARDLGTRETFADVAATLAEFFQLPRVWSVGKSFLDEMTARPLLGILTPLHSWISCSIIIAGEEAITRFSERNLLVLTAGRIPEQKEGDANRVRFPRRGQQPLSGDRVIVMGRKRFREHRS